MATDTDPEGMPIPSGDSTTELLKEAIDEARELARLEVALAKNEAFAELRDLKTSAIAFGVAFVAALLGVALLLTALAVALGGTIAALIIGGVLLVIGGGAALVGLSKLPEEPLAETRRRLKEDVKQLKERVA
jgi:nitrogen fixation/metabolism regulation signal transduction histidine kinase